MRHEKNLRGFRTLRHAALVLACSSLPSLVYGESNVDFNRDIRPILSDNCFKCHGPDEATREAELRLDTAEGALADRGGYRAIDRQVPAASALIARITSADEANRMPPVDSGRRLSKRQIELLRKWVKQGAPYDLHWAFRPVQRPDVPMAISPWVCNQIDAFVFEQLDREKLVPSAIAPRHTLIRRVYLDLLGLPPTPAEVREYISDPSPDAYQKMVERALASPHYGERWGRHWLDQARYADTNGYSVDADRSMWPYRDWVIQALNDDMPFDQFTVEQLAGDLLPNPSPNQLVATGFHRNTLINQEGGTDNEQFRVEAVVDRVNTTGAVWLGLTIACAQCHSHKFDPISQREYYELFAFFNNCEDVNTAPPELEIAGARTMILRELMQPRETHVLVRGDFLRKGELVSPGTPAVLPPLAVSDGPRTRLDLARWLVSRENPLTARATVNRVWARYFGRGLVETENDFGLQCTPPTHPELLDWLAAEFMEQGWSLKRLHRLILASATYQQSSNHRKDLAAVDPLNKLLGRQARLRVEAEIVRDLGLAVSGLLHTKIGGPGVYPPQAGDVYTFTQVPRNWPASNGPDRYRRGMYTFFVRSAPYPMLTTFDSPVFNTTCTFRQRSNTPLQALSMANDETMVEMARSLADRIYSHTGNDRERLNYAYELCFARPTDTRELERLETYLAEQTRQYASAPDAIRQLAGEASAEAAAWIATARVILNLDEFITRE